jgi:hypothetical protein
MGSDALTLRRSTLRMPGKGSLSICGHDPGRLHFVEALDRRCGGCGEAECRSAA